MYHVIKYLGLYHLLHLLLRFACYKSMKKKPNLWFSPRQFSHFLLKGPHAIRALIYIK